MPNFEMSYLIDPVRQKIADSWPDSIDDSVGKFNIFCFIIVFIVTIFIVYTFTII